MVLPLSCFVPILIPADLGQAADWEVIHAGLLSIVTNFKQTKDAVSGPLAIVAAGADVARSDSASLLQFAAIVNVNLAMVNALPLPVKLWCLLIVHPCEFDR